MAHLHITNMCLICLRSYEMENRKKLASQTCPWHWNCPLIWFWSGGCPTLNWKDHLRQEKQILEIKAKSLPRGEEIETTIHFGYFKGRNHNLLEKLSSWNERVWKECWDIDVSSLVTHSHPTLCGLYPARQAPRSMGFSRQEHWGELPFLPPGDLSDSGIKPASPVSPVFSGKFFTTEPPGKPRDVSIRG